MRYKATFPRTWIIYLINLKKEKSEVMLVGTGKPSSRSMGLVSTPLHVIIDLFGFYVFFFSQYRSCDNTLENCFLQISSYTRAYLRINYEKTKG